MVASKKLKSMSSRSEALASGASVVGKSWDSTQLRLGDHAAISAGDDKMRARAIQWDPHGTMKLAFSRTQSSLQPTHRHVDARGAVVHAALQSQKDALDKALAHGPCYIERSFDDTPVHVDFGNLSEDLCPFVRFFVPHRHVGAVGKTMVEYKEATLFGVPRHQHGIIDIMAQSVAVQCHGHRASELALPPRVMQGKTAAHVFQCMETMCDGKVGLDGILSLAPGLLLLVDVADSASSNRKAMKVMGIKTAGTSILYWPQRCSVHQCVRGVIRLLQKEENIQKLFCVTNVLHITSRQEAMKRAIIQVVCSSLYFYQA